MFSGTISFWVQHSCLVEILARTVIVESGTT